MCDWIIESRKLSTAQQSRIIKDVSYCLISSPKKGSSNDLHTRWHCGVFVCYDAPFLTREYRQRSIVESINALRGQIASTFENKRRLRNKWVHRRSYFVILYFVFLWCVDDSASRRCKESITSVNMYKVTSRNVPAYHWWAIMFQ